MLNTRKKRIIASIVIVIVIILITPFFIAMSIYKDNFGERFQTPIFVKRDLNEFEGLKAKRYTFESNNGQQLVGYSYYKDTVNPKGLIVIAHGFGGGGHNSYMDIADYFVSNGYNVFAYDATGNDESEGESVIGIPQGVIDLDYALQFVKNNDDFSNLPIMLFGHSWGGYSVGSVLNLHTDIKAVVMFAGFNSSVDIIKEQGRQIVGDGIEILSPYVSLLERFKFGKYATYSCIDGLGNVDTEIMIIHSADDSMISIKNSYDVFYDLYSDNPRFKFIKFEDRGHNYLYYTDEARQYINGLYDQCRLHSSTPNEKMTPEMMSDFFIENMNREIYFELDEKLLTEVVEFYDSYVE